MTTGWDSSKPGRKTARTLKDYRDTVPPDKGGGSAKGGRLRQALVACKRSLERGRYLCVGGNVYAADGSKSFVSCCRLPALYGVHPRECVFVPDAHVPLIELTADGRLTGSPKLDGMDSRTMILLRPDSTGAYQIPSLEKTG